MKTSQRHVKQRGALLFHKCLNLTSAVSHLKPPAPPYLTELLCHCVAAQETGHRELESLTSQLFRRHRVMNNSWATGGGSVRHWTCGTLWYAAREPSLCPRVAAVRRKKKEKKKRDPVWEVGPVWKERQRPAAWWRRQLTAPTLLFIFPFLNVAYLLLKRKPSWGKGFSICRAK